jgi:hypothetical protein
MQDWNGCASYGLYGVAGIRNIGPLVFIPAVMGKTGQAVAQAEKLAAKHEKASGKAASLRQV